MTLLILPPRPLGKLPKREDPRNLIGADFFAARTTPPHRYSFLDDRADLLVIDQGQHNDCVAASIFGATMVAERGERRANYTPRGVVGGGMVEYQDILTFYDAIRPGGASAPDEGAYILDGLKRARAEGVTLSYARRPQPAMAKGAAIPFKIAAFVEGQPLTKSAIIDLIWNYRLGVLGTSVPDELFNVHSGQVNYVGGQRVWGGHALYWVGYVERPMLVKIGGGRRALVEGIEVVPSWAGYERQWLSWSFVEHYVDEIYGLVDAKDNVPATIQRPALMAEVARVTGGSVR